MKRLALLVVLVAFVLVAAAGSVSAENGILFVDDGDNDSIFAVVPPSNDGPEDLCALPNLTPVDPVYPVDPEDDEDEEFEDSDGDGIADEDDDCPDLYGSPYNGGCPIEEEDEDMADLVDIIDELSGEGAGMEFVGSCNLIHGAAVDVVGLLVIALGLVPMALGRTSRRR